MDDQILENFDVTTVAVNNAAIVNERMPSVLRGIEGGTLHFITVPAGRDQEFIDHSLLNPEYITTHIPNGFIIDFMSNQDNTNSDQHSSSVSTVSAGTETAHFITESSPVNTIIHHHNQQHQQNSTNQQHQQQQQHIAEFHHQHDDENDRKLTAAFLQLVNTNKQYPVKITSNEAQVIVTNKDVLHHLGESCKQQQQQQTQNSVVVTQNLLTSTSAIDDDDRHHQQRHQHQQPQQTITQTFLDDNQFRIYEPSSSTQMHINSSLPPLTPISRLTRSSNRKCTNNLIIQNTQTKVNSNYGNLVICNNNLKSTDDALVVNEDIESKSQQQRPLAKKNLPHKKRITKKLKIIDRVTESQPLEQQHQQQQQQQQQNQFQITDITTIDNSRIPKENVSIFSEESNTITMHQFTCQLCGAGSDSQLDFFSHLKEHYEPEPIMEKISQNVIPSSPKKEILAVEEFSASNNLHFDNDNFVNNDNKQKQISDENKIETVINNQIQNNINVTTIEIIHNQQEHHETIQQHQHHVNNVSNQNEENDLHHNHQPNQNNNSNNNNNNNHVTTPPSPKGDDLQVTEVEFSDTEDMLEGIRGVVDKVQESVDNDSNDCMNLINGRSWYSNGTLNGAIVTNPSLEETPVENFALFNRSDIEKLIEQQEQSLDNGQTTITEETVIDNTSVHDIELPSANELEISMDSVEIPPPPELSEDNLPLSERLVLARKQKKSTKANKEEKPKRGRKPKAKKNEKKLNKTKDKLGDNQLLSIDGKVQNNFNDNDNLNDNEYVVGDIDNDDGDDGDGNDDGILKFKTKKRLKCSKCDKLFNSANALKYHDLSHTGERPHQCEVCGKSFFAQSALKVHMRLHSGDKPYICEFCNRAFRQWGDLKYHTISIHTDTKSFQCEFCGKAFARRYSLVVHRRIHTCEKNYKCEFCPKSFRASSYLQNHRKIHTGEKPYTCKFCGKKFRVCGDLRRHENIHTRDKRKPKKTGTDKKEQAQKCNSVSAISAKKNSKDGKREEAKNEKLSETVLSEIKIEMVSTDDQTNIANKSEIKNSKQKNSLHKKNIMTIVHVDNAVNETIKDSTLSPVGSHDISIFKTEPNFESTSSSDITLNNTKIEITSSSHQQQHGGDSPKCRSYFENLLRTELL